MWEGTRTLGETRDKGDPSGASGRVSKRRHLPRFLFCKTRTHLFMSTDAFESRRKMSFRRPHPSSLTTTAACYAIPSNFRPCGWSKAPPPTPFAFNGLAGVRIILGVYTLGDTSWWVARRGANGGVNSPPLLESPAAA